MELCVWRYNGVEIAQENLPKKSIEKSDLLPFPVRDWRLKESREACIGGPRPRSVYSHAWLEIINDYFAGYLSSYKIIQMSFTRRSNKIHPFY